MRTAHLRCASFFIYGYNQPNSMAVVCLLSNELERVECDLYEFPSSSAMSPNKPTRSVRAA